MTKIGYLPCSGLRSANSASQLGSWWQSLFKFYLLADGGCRGAGWSGTRANITSHTDYLLVQQVIGQMFLLVIANPGLGFTLCVNWDLKLS